MSSTELNREAARQLMYDTILGPAFRRATFSGARRGEKPCLWRRVLLRALELRGERWLQFSYFDATKDTTKNFRDAEAAQALTEILDASFSRIHLTTSAAEIDVQTTKKGKILLSRRAETHAESLPTHNRTKDVPLPEGRANRLLEVLGIMTGSGQVRPTMRAKYTQINEFLKQLLHVLDDAGLRTLGRAVQILDCGCGSSYLTLALHYYLNEMLRLPAHIIGVDVNEEVIRKSSQRSERLGAEGLEFRCQRIGALTVSPDIVVALHACDTATDDAVAHGIAADARVLLSVPCCHHHLNEALRAEGDAAVLRPLLRHGILHQRTADLVTDAFRALVLRIMGYRTDVVEFISTEHTARNLMLRAVRGAPVGEAVFVREYLEMRRFWGVSPYIEGMLGERFQQLLAALPERSAQASSASVRSPGITSPR
jgi:SAM-dependent methyltransferase